MGFLGTAGDGKKLFGKPPSRYSGLIRKGASILPSALTQLAIWCKNGTLTGLALLEEIGLYTDPVCKEVAVCSFNGTDQDIELPVVLIPATDDFTIEGFVNLGTDYTGVQAIVAQYVAALPNRLSFYRNGNDVGLHFDADYRITATLTTGAWYKIKLTRVGTTFEVFTALIGASYVSAGTYVSATAVAQVTTLMGALGSGAGGFFNGFQSAMTINVSNYPLSEDTGPAYDRSGNANHGILSSHTMRVRDTTGTVPCQNYLNGFASVAPPVELVINGDFATKSVWVEESGTTYALVGGRGEVTTAGLLGIYQEVATTSGKIYTVTGDMQNSTGSSIAIWALTGGALTPVLGKSTPYADTDNHVGVTFDFVATTASARVYLRVAGSGSVGFFDNISVKESYATYIPALISDPLTAADGSAVTNKGQSVRTSVHNGAECSVYYTADDITFTQDDYLAFLGRVSGVLIAGASFWFKWEKIDGVCHLIEMFGYKTSYILTDPDKDQNLAYVGTADCGAGKIVALRDVNDEVIRDVNSEIVYVLP